MAGGNLNATFVAGSAVSPTQPDEPAPPERAPVTPTIPDEPVAKPNPGRTLLGLAPVAPPAQPPAPEAAPGQTKRTMIGLAPGPDPSEPPPAPTPAQEPVFTSHKKTKVGLAHPGIVPLHLGAPAPRQPNRPAAARKPVRYDAPRPVELSTEDLAVLPGRGRKPRARAVLLIAAAVCFFVLLVACVVAFFWWRGLPPIEARVEIDSSGQERIELLCRSPCEYARVHVGSRSAEFVQDKAGLSLEQPLSMGENRLELQLERPGGGRSALEVTLPVDYRLKTDFAGLSEPVPKVAVLVEATAETAVVLDGRPVSLDAQGRGRHEIDVARDLTGPATAVMPLERRVPYGVTRPRSDPRSGELPLRIGIVPLLVDAPGSSIVIET
jgi:hypothetical protein